MPKGVAITRRQPEKDAPDQPGFEQLGRPSPEAQALHKPVFLAFLAWFLVCFTMICLRLEWSREWQTLDGVLPGLASLTLLIGLARRLPAQNVLMSAALILCISSILVALSSATGVPFGKIQYSDHFGPLVFGLFPWVAPCLWVTVLVSARSIARLVMRPWRKTYYYGFWVIGLTLAAALVFLWPLEIFSSQVMRYWSWQMPARQTWLGVPWTFFIGSFSCSVGILFISTPWLINKQPVKLPTDYHPLVVWTLLLIYFLTAIGLHHLYLCLAVSAPAAIVLLVFAVRGGEWGK